MDKHPPHTSLILLLLTICLGASFCSGLAADLRGDFCASRAEEQQCCDGRQDGCALPILGTLCYCDVFCNRTRPDCCPDYAKVCLGEKEDDILKECYFDGKYYQNGETFQVNCNKCMCQEIQDQMDLLCEKNRCIIDTEAMAAINGETRKAGWRASNHSQFWGETLTKGLERMLGTLHSRRKVLSMTPLKQVIRPETLPKEFDARTKWRGIIHPPYSQDWCAASWVFSTVGVASDRWGIMTKGRIREPLSPQHLLSCNSKNQKGCAGGHLSRAWNFVKKFGLVSESCYPWTADNSRCKIPKNKDSLEARCYSDAQGFDKKPLYRMGPVYRVISEDGIMQEIINSGPVQATMRVHPDFFMYSGGIYRCGAAPPSQLTGFHSVRIVGWGEEDQGNRPVKYWIVANSWGSGWGEQGYFRIKKGSNECRIEDFVLGAWISMVSRRPSARDVLLSGRNAVQGDNQI